jgi:hypothetical protein
MATIIPNQEDKLLMMGDLYYSTDYDSSSDSITELTATNQSTVKSELDTYTFATVWHIKEFSISHSLENEEIIRAGNCWVGEIARLVEKTPTISFTRLDVNNRTVFDKMLGLDKLTVAGTPVSVTTEIIAASGKSAGDIYILANKNGDNTVVGSVVVDDDGTPLTLDTDYTLAVDSDGSITWTIWNSYIVFLADTSTNQIDVDYEYTPNASTLDGYNIEKTAVPYGMYKFVSCVNPISSNEWVKNTVYFWKYVMTGEMVEAFIDRVETELAWAEVSFVGATGWGYLTVKETVSL